LATNLANADTAKFQAKDIGFSVCITNGGSGQKSGRFESTHQKTLLPAITGNPFEGRHPVPDNDARLIGR